MCMKITDPRKLKVDKNGFCTGWKLVRKVDNSAPYHWVHRPYIYNEGENVCSRSVKINDYEARIGEVRTGFHIYQTRADARLGIKIYADCMTNKPTEKEMVKIIKVYFKPEDIVAYGLSQDILYRPAKSLVVTKLTIKSLASAD